METSVFSFTCYREFLNSWHEKKSQNEKHWSLGQFARHAGLSNTTAISNILKGRKTPSPETIEKLAEILKLNQREQMYFEALVEKKRFENSNILQTSLVKILNILKPKLSHKEIACDEFDAISNPSYYILREIVKLKDFRYDLQWIQNKIAYPLSLQEINQAIETLIKIRLLKEEDNCLKQSVDFFESTTDIPSTALKKFHKEVLKYTTDNIEKVDIKQRHYTSDTIVIDGEDLPQIKAILELFRKEVSAFDRDKGDHVYHFNMQLTPATKK